MTLWLHDPIQRDRWEATFDEVVATAAEHRLSDALVQLKRLRAWQGRRERGGPVNNRWHDAELLWVEGVILELAGDAPRAGAVWLRLARLFTRIAPHKSYFLPEYVCCASRELGFAPNWFSVANQLRDGAHDLAATAEQFRQYAVGERHRPGLGPVPDPVPVLAPVSPPSANEPKRRDGSPVSAATLRSKRENIRLACDDLNQPAVVVHLSEEYMKLDPLNGVVWMLYGQGLAELGRHEEAATAFQTARGLVSKEENRSVVITYQGDLDYERGRLPEAEARYREALEASDGSHHWPWIMLGRIRFQLGALAEAEQCFRSAVAAKGNYPATALYELGLVLRARSSLFEARRVLKQAVALSSHVSAHEALADVERVIRLQSRNGRKPRASSDQSDQSD